MLTTDLNFSGNLKLITDDHLKSLINYALFVEVNKESFKAQPVEPRDDNKCQVYPVTLSDKIIGLKLHHKQPGSFKNEYDRAVYDGEEARKLIELATEVLATNNSKTVSKRNEKYFFTTFAMNQEDIQLTFQIDFTKRLLDDMTRIDIERKMTSESNKIKQYLKLKFVNVYPRKAVECINKLLKCDLDGLMLTKHAHVVHLIRHLKTYVGNVDDWNLSEKQLEKFNNEAANIRAKSGKLYEKIKEIFGFADYTDDDFLIEFYQIESDFNDKCKEMFKEDILNLSYMPFSRKWFLFENYEDYF